MRAANVGPDFALWQGSRRDIELFLVLDLERGSAGGARGECGVSSGVWRVVPQGGPRGILPSRASLMSDVGRDETVGYVWRQVSYSL